jgi:hypothetical protein
MKTILTTSLLSAALAAVASAQVTIINENFDSLTAPALPSTLTATGNVETVADAATALSGTVSLWINETRNSNIWTTQALGLVNGVTTESTMAFDWTDATTYSGAFGRFPQIQWSNDGSSFFTVAQISVPSSNDGSVNWQAVSYSVTAGQSIGANTVSFGADSAWRVVGDNDGGGGGAPFVVDNLLVTADAVPEPGSFALIGGFLALTSIMLRRRRS